MAVTAAWYGVPVKNLFDGTIAQIDWNTDTIKVALLNNTHVLDQDTDDFFSDVEPEEISGTGYTAGGMQLTTPTITYDTATDEVRLDADDTAWTTSTFTARFGIVYKDLGGVTTADPLIGYIDFGADQTVSSGTFTITWAATGVMKLDATVA